MDNLKRSLPLVGVGIVFGFVVAWILFSYGATVDSINVGPLNIKLPLFLGRTTDPISGQWVGAFADPSSNFSTVIKLNIHEDCRIGSVCGTYSAPDIGCSGDLQFIDSIKDTYIFLERNTEGESHCTSGGYEYLHLFDDNTLSWAYKEPGRYAHACGLLTHR